MTLYETRLLGKLRLIPLWHLIIDGVVVDDIRSDKRPGEGWVETEKEKGVKD